MVDPRTELLSAVQLLSGRDWTRTTRFNFAYKHSMTEYFAPYKEHRAVELFKQMTREGFSCDAPATLMLYLSDPPELEPQIPLSSLPSGIPQRAGGEKRLAEFVRALRDFARDTEFQRFYHRNERTYRAIVKDVDAKVRSSDIVGPVRTYYGSVSPLRYTIILAPLLHRGGYGPSVKRPGGARELYNICGPQGAASGLPRFGEAEQIRGLAWHEFGHSFVNPLADKYWNTLAQYSSLYEPIAGVMSYQAYGSWKTCVNEHIVRAVEARIISKVDGDKAADRFIQKQHENGFAYIGALCAKLDYYEKHRDRFRSFEDFYPELVGVFGELHKRKLGPDFYSWNPVHIDTYVHLRTIRAIAQVLIIALMLNAASAIWAFRDARRRKKRGWLVGLLVFFIIWPLGLLAWLAFRPVRHQE